MANPCGTRTPCPDSFWKISPSDAFFPPTSGTSSMPNSSKKRTYPDILMTCPLVARQAVGSIEPDPYVTQHRTRPISLPDTAARDVQAAQETIGALVSCRFVAERPKRLLAASSSGPEFAVGSGH